MINFLDKVFFRANNLDYISHDIKELSKNAAINKIFNLINSYSVESEIRYVGGCIRKIIKKEKIDDIDFATNLTPKQVCEALEKENIDYYKSGIEHGTITTNVDGYKFEITTLREDISTDGRHAQVKFSNDWKKDASRRDFTINSIYSDSEGNLFDPYDGKKDLEKGHIKFIGDPDKRIKEDYLRILRYLRFFTSYSKNSHNTEVIRKLKVNISGINKLSKERLLDELKKIANLDILFKLSNNKLSLEIFSLIFPELKGIKIFQKLNSHTKAFLKDLDFVFLLSLMIIDETDNTDYFLYKFNISKKDKKRIKIIDDFFKNKLNKDSFAEKNMNKVFYYKGRQAVIDILYFRLIKFKKFEHNLRELVNNFENKKLPILPIGADVLINKYKIPAGIQLGLKLKKIEEEWVNSNFKISDQQVENIINN